MHVLVTFDISNDYATWKEAFDAHAPARDAAGIAVTYAGHKLDDPSKIVMILSIPSMDAFEGFMSAPESAQSATEAGHLLDTTIVTPIS